MATKPTILAVRGLIGATILGLVLVGIAFALIGVWDAWNYPHILENKSGEKARTVLGHAARLFCLGAIIGGLCGMVAGAGIAAKRLWWSDKKTH
jgi:hypothetical protein